jgi:hypothetical protein
VQYDGPHPKSFLEKDYLPFELKRYNRIWLIFSDFVVPLPGGEQYNLIQMIRKDFDEVLLEKCNGTYLYLFLRKTH